MAGKMKLIPVLAIVLLLSVGELRSQPPPSIGDIRLVPYTSDPNLQNHYEVQIYYTDGTSTGSYGGVCADDTYDTEAKIICQQMGYQYKTYSKRQISTTPVWLTHISCEDSNISHILRCKVTVATEADRTTCSPNNYRLLVNCDFSEPLPQYDGEVTLCPVNSDSSTRVSTSYGLVSIFYQEHQANEGINQKGDQPLGGIEADTICRNLGFTGAYPWSAKSRAADNYNFSKCFSNTGPRPPYRVNHGAWVATNDIKCDGTQTCIGCCMKYPLLLNCEDCDDHNNIVIRCMFDPSKILPNDVIGDRSKDCKLDENKKVAQCVPDSVVLSQPPPAIGDIRLVPYTSDPALQGHYEVQIYYADGASEGSYGGVCADDTYDKEGKVICQQMGYQYKTYSKRQISTSPVWFTHIDCDDSNTSHILRCKTKVATEVERTTCSPNNYRLLVNCDFSRPMPQYDGQVTLCPVNSDNSTRVSTSYGLVSIYYKQYQANEGINQKGDQPLGGIEANTICRNLGFTGAYPWSTKSKAVDNYNFSNCFSNTGPRPPHRLNHGAWVATDDIKCDGTQTCIGCCMKYPLLLNCEDCDDHNNIVIRCTFDPSKILPNDVTGDRSKDCRLNKNKNVGQCVQAIPDNNDQLGLKVGIPVSIFVAVVIFVPICCTCYCRRRRGYKTIVDQEDNADQPNREN